MYSILLSKGEFGSPGRSGARRQMTNTSSLLVSRHSNMRAVSSSLLTFSGVSCGLPNCSRDARAAAAAAAPASARGTGVSDAVKRPASGMRGSLGCGACALVVAAAAVASAERGAERAKWRSMYGSGTRRGIRSVISDPSLWPHSRSRSPPIARAMPRTTKSGRPVPPPLSAGAMPNGASIWVHSSWLRGRPGVSACTSSTNASADGDGDPGGLAARSTETEKVTASGEGSAATRKRTLDWSGIQAPSRTADMRTLSSAASSARSSPTAMAGSADSGSGSAHATRDGTPPKSLIMSTARVTHARGSNGRSAPRVICPSRCSCRMLSTFETQRISTVHAASMERSRLHASWSAATAAKGSSSDDAAWIDAHGVRRS